MLDGSREQLDVFLLLASSSLPSPWLLRLFTEVNAGERERERGVHARPRVHVDAHGVSYLTDEDVYDDPRTGHLVHHSPVPCTNVSRVTLSLPLSLFPSFFL